MATKSKNTNVLTKIICVILSLICVFGAAHFAMNILTAVNAYHITAEDFNGAELGKSVAQSNKIRESVERDIQNMNYQLQAKDSNRLKKEFAKRKTDFVNSLTKSFIEEKAYFSENEGEEFFNAEYPIEIDGLVYSIQIYSDDRISFLTDDESSARQKLNEKFDRFLKNKDFSNFAIIENRDYSDCVLGAYDKVNKTSFSSTDNAPEEKDVMSHEYAFVYKNGNVTCSKGFEGLFESVSVFNKNYDYYFYVDENDGSFSGYTAMIDTAKQGSNVNLLKSLIIATVLTLISLIFAIICFAIFGKKLENGKVKRAFIDYVPTDLHILISGFLISVSGIAAAFIIDLIISYAYPFENLLRLALYGTFAIAWALFIECVTSIIRVCKSENGIIQNLLIYKAVRYLIIKPAKFIYRKVRPLLSYKFNNFNKMITRWIAGFAAVNILFLIVIDNLSFSSYKLVFIFGWVAFNGAVISKAVEYLKSLDIIITAAHYRQTPQVDYNKLPESLKILVNSLNYTNAELKNAVDKAVADERMRTELITNVSHDLKTPLTSIISYVDLLKTCDITDENAKEYIDILDEKGGKLKRLIEDLIEASKITSGVINIEPFNINLAELATQAVVEHQQEFTDNSLTLVFKGDKRVVNAFADGNKTYRVIENLISNARKYSLKGTRVYADVYETQNYSIFEIKNTSAEPLDIPVSELKERFVRGDKSRTNEGNGLGLSIADNLCRAQNGYLNITIDGDLFKAQVMLPKVKN